MNNLKTFIFSLFLLVVLAVGIPLDPLSSWSYEITKYFGIDIPMTPLTSDMAMMSDLSGKTSYEKKLTLVVYSKNQTRQINEKNLLFYKHKIPLHLYFEIISDGEEANEGRFYVCKMLQEFIKKEKIEGYELVSNNKNKENRLMGFNQRRNCNE